MIISRDIIGYGKEAPLMKEIFNKIFGSNFILFLVGMTGGSCIFVLGLNGFRFQDWSFHGIFINFASLAALLIGIIINTISGHEIMRIFTQESKL